MASCERVVVDPLVGCPCSWGCWRYLLVKLLRRGVFSSCTSCVRSGGTNGSTRAVVICRVIGAKGARYASSCKYVLLRRDCCSELSRKRSSGQQASQVERRRHCVANALHEHKRLLACSASCACVTWWCCCGLCLRGCSVFNHWKTKQATCRNQTAASTSLPSTYQTTNESVRKPNRRLPPDQNQQAAASGAQASDLRATSQLRTHQAVASTQTPQASSRANKKQFRWPQWALARFGWLVVRQVVVVCE